MHSDYSPYGSYHGLSTGRILHWVYLVCGLSLAESAVIGGKSVYRDHTEKEILATYVWKKVRGMSVPVFIFTSDLYNERYKEIRDEVEALDIAAEFEASFQEARRQLEVLSKADPKEYFQMSLCISNAKEFINKH